jgi:hypothetical protein
MDRVETWIAVFFTLSMLSFLYKENWLYRLGEHIFVGTAAAHSVIMAYQNYVEPTIRNDIIAKGQATAVIPAVLGLLVYARYVKAISWLSKLPIAFWIGVGAGNTLAYQPAPFLSQISASFLNMANPSNFVFVLCLVGTLVYFFFTVTSTNPVYRVLSPVGRCAMMVAFGSAFANTVMARVSLFLGRMQFLLGDWLGIIK